MCEHITRSQAALSSSSTAARELRRSCELQGVKNGSQQRENSVHFTGFFDKDENASQAAEIVNGVYSANTVTANYVQFWFRRFRSGIFDA
ncbi:hypothetical protein TNCV_4604431 [Trichonephila clavipes]|nr:hypothetical protein TNCV_4604431 [Trichonephila clavipes]